MFYEDEINKYFDNRIFELEKISEEHKILNNKIILNETEKNIRIEDIEIEIEKMNEKRNIIDKVINDEEISQDKLLIMREKEKENINIIIQEIEDQIIKLKNTENNSEIGIMYNKYKSIKFEENYDNNKDKEKLLYKIKDIEIEIKNINSDIDKIKESIHMIDEDFQSSEMFLINVISFQESIEEVLSSYSFMKSFPSSNFLIYVNNKKSIENFTKVLDSDIEITTNDLKVIDVRRFIDCLNLYFRESFGLSYLDIDNISNHFIRIINTDHFFEDISIDLYNILKLECEKMDLVRIVEDIELLRLKKFLKYFTKYLYYDYVISTHENLNNEYKNIRKFNKQLLNESNIKLSMLYNRKDNYDIKLNKFEDKTFAIKQTFEVKLKTLAILDDKLNDLIKYKNEILDEIISIKNKKIEKVENFRSELKSIDKIILQHNIKKNKCNDEFLKKNSVITDDINKNNKKVDEILKKLKNFVNSLTLNPNIKRNYTQPLIHNITKFSNYVSKTFIFNNLIYDPFFIELKENIENYSEKLNEMSNNRVDTIENNINENKNKFKYNNDDKRYKIKKKHSKNCNKGYSDIYNKRSNLTSQRSNSNISNLNEEKENNSMISKSREDATEIDNKSENTAVHQNNTDVRDSHVTTIFIMNEDNTNIVSSAEREENKTFLRNFKQNRKTESKSFNISQNSRYKNINWYYESTNNLENNYTENVLLTENTLPLSPIINKKVDNNSFLKKNSGNSSTSDQYNKETKFIDSSPDKNYKSNTNSKINLKISNVNKFISTKNKRKIIEIEDFNRNILKTNQSVIIVDNHESYKEEKNNDDINLPNNSISENFEKNINDKSSDHEITENDNKLIIKKAIKSPTESNISYNITNPSDYKITSNEINLASKSRHTTNENKTEKYFSSYNRYTLNKKNNKPKRQNRTRLSNNYISNIFYEFPQELKNIIQGTYAYYKLFFSKVDVFSINDPKEEGFVKVYLYYDNHNTKLKLVNSVIGQIDEIPVYCLEKVLISKVFKDIMTVHRTYLQLREENIDPDKYFEDNKIITEELRKKYLNVKYFHISIALNTGNNVDILLLNYLDCRNWLNGLAYLLNNKIC